MGAFKNWLQFQELSIGTDGMRDNTATQTAQASMKVAQKFLGNRHHSDDVSNLITTAKSNRSALAGGIIDVAAKAIEFAPTTLRKQTTAPQVAGVIQNQLKLPQVVPPPKPTQVKMMRRKMRKK
jgi:hypothetical protein